MDYTDSDKVKGQFFYHLKVKGCCLFILLDT